VIAKPVCTKTMLCPLLLSILFCLACQAAGMPQGDQQDNLCRNYLQFGYFCVPYYQCNTQNKIITDGGDLFDPRQADDNQDCLTGPDISKVVTSTCGKLLDVCCQHPNQTAQQNCPEENSEYDDYGLDYNDDIFGSDEEDRTFKTNNKDDINSDVDNDIFQDGPAAGSPGLCGKRNTNGLAQTENLKPSVDEAGFGEWPHVCALLKKEFVEEELVKVYLCGASLIADGVVLTAGHCVNDTETLKNKLVVRCGEWDTQSEDEDQAFQEQDVETIEIHPEFNVNNHHNNFALLFLSSPMLVSSHISPVCLPRPNDVFAEQNCVSNGWGKDKFGAEGRYSTILKEVVVPLVDNRKCQDLLRKNTRLGTFFELDSSFICAGGQKSIDTCKGDGGSSLTCRHPSGPWFQAGIVSWGIGCGENDTPAVYAAVSGAACWIDHTVKCNYGQADSYFGFTTRDCPQEWECPQQFVLDDIFA